MTNLTNLAHSATEERKLADPEMPLLVQLNWHKDDREGRFLLRRMDEKTYVSVCIAAIYCCVVAVVLCDELGS